SLARLPARLHRYPLYLLGRFGPAIQLKAKQVLGPRPGRAGGQHHRAAPRHRQADDIRQPAVRFRVAGDDQFVAAELVGAHGTAIWLRGGHFLPLCYHEGLGRAGPGTPARALEEVSSRPCKVRHPPPSSTSSPTWRLRAPSGTYCIWCRRCTGITALGSWHRRGRCCPSFSASASSTVPSRAWKPVSEKASPLFAAACRSCLRSFDRASSTSMPARNWLYWLAQLPGRCRSS